MVTQANIDKLKAEYQTKLEQASKEVREHVDEYGTLPCDYLTIRRNRELNYRTSYNVLIELERM